MSEPTQAGAGVVRRRIPKRRPDHYKENCRTVSRMQAVLYEEFGGHAAGPLAKIDSELFAYVCFLCGEGTGDLEGRALSAEHAARVMTKMLKRPVSHKQARNSLARLRGRSAVHVKRRNFRGHGTNWYRPDAEFLTFIAALGGPVKGQCRANEGPTRSVSSLTPSHKKNPPHPRGAGEPKSKTGGTRVNPRALGISPRQIADAWDDALDEDDYRRRRARMAWAEANDPDPPPGGDERRGEGEAWEAWKARQCADGYMSGPPSRHKQYRWVRRAIRSLEKGEAPDSRLQPTEKNPDGFGLPYGRAHWEWIGRTLEAYVAGTLPERAREFIAHPPKFEWSTPSGKLPDFA